MNSACWLGGQALRLPRDGVFPWQAERLPYNEQRGFLIGTML